MPAGLQVFTQAGNKVFDSEWGHARALGTITVLPSVPTGSYTVPSSQGVLYKLFAYTLPTNDVAVYRTIRDEVTVSGRTIYWKNLVFPMVGGIAHPIKIVYGDGYK